VDAPAVVTPVNALVDTPNAALVDAPAVVTPVNTPDVDVDVDGAANSKALPSQRHVLSPTVS